jgi:RNA polymerase sigma factor (sigma-70 family)
MAREDVRSDELYALRAYAHRTVARKGFGNRERDSLVQSIIELLGRVEAEKRDYTLLQRIEEKLRTRSLKNTEEHRLLQQAMGSVIEPHTRRTRAGEEHLGDDCRNLPSRELEPCDHLEKEDLRQRVQQEVNALPEQQRALIVRVYWDGQTQSEFAREVGRDRQRISDDHAKAIRILAERLRHLQAVDGK